MSLAYYTVSEISKKLNVSNLTVRRYIKSDKIKAYKLGRELRIEKKEFHRFFQSLKETNQQSLFYTPTTSSTPSFTFIDLFAGIGGFHFALKQLGGKCVFASEIDKHARKTYITNFYNDEKELFDSGNFNEDITKIDPQDIADHDILCAGFPCQPFSISGKRQGFNDIRGTLFFEIVKIVAFHKPPIVFLENVKNFSTHDHGNTLHVVKTTLQNLNYNFYCKVLNSSDYGAITSRERTYMIAIRKDVDTLMFDFPLPTRTTNVVEDILETYSIHQKLKIPKDKVVFTKSQNDLVRLHKKNRPIQIGYINKGGQGERVYSPKGHAITLSAHGGGIFSKTGGYYINDSIRKLTPRECARVMGFPETFVIPVSESQAYKQFGNSVALPVVYKIAQKLIRTIQIWHKNIQVEKAPLLQNQDLIMNKV